MSICLISAQIPRQSSPPRRQSATKSAAATRKEMIVCGLRKRCLKVAGAPSAASLGSIGEEVVGSMTLSHVSRMNYLLIIPNAPQSPLTARRVCALPPLIAHKGGITDCRPANSGYALNGSYYWHTCLPHVLEFFAFSPETMHLAASFEHRYTKKKQRNNSATSMVKARSKRNGPFEAAM